MPAQMSSEKFIRAERKNRLEGHRLKVTCTHFDKETVRMNYEIDREKRGIIRSFRTVIKTSGASDLGVPPENDRDTDFEKCPSYMQGLKLSNKRLLEWRTCEKQLDNFIRTHEEERKKDSRKKVLKKRTNGYTVIPAKSPDDVDDDVFIDDNASLTASEKTSPIDLLKDNPDNPDEKFDIKKWEADLIENYKSSVCKSTSSENQNGDTKSNLRSKSSPTISTRTSEYENQKAKRVRPHTAQARVRPPSGRSSVSRRPASANAKRTDSPSQFLITKQSTYIKTGQTFEKLLDNRPVDKPLMVNNYLSSLRPPSTSKVEKEPSVSSLRNLCPVVEGDEDDDDAISNFDKAEKQSEITNVTKKQSNSNLKPGHVENSNLLSPTPDTSGLSLKFQRKLKKKLLRARSAGSGVNSQQNGLRGNFKHSNSDLSSYMEGSSRRSRHDSESMSSMVSVPLSRTGSIVSIHRPSVSLGLPSDIEDISRGQEKLASEITPDKPLSVSKLVSVTKVVRAAMTFSRMARKRALTKMQNDNSSDTHEIIRQERLRKLQSRQHVLNSLSSQWQSDQRPETPDSITIQQVD